MPNKNYEKGRRKEYKVCEQLKKEGFDIVQRTAGSHSPIDIIAIDLTCKVIKLIQCKPDDYKADKLKEEWNQLNNAFRVEFEVV